jgi:glutamate synthase (NADPH/NADH) small chain
MRPGLPPGGQCEGKCIVGKKGDPVAIGNLERFAADWARGQQRHPHAAHRRRPTGKKVAVVGSGPGGITVAGDLIRKGHEVTLYEAFHKPGGVLVYGIPEFRLPKEIVAHGINFLEQLGVKVECNVVVGRTVTVDELMNEEGYRCRLPGRGRGPAPVPEYARRKPDGRLSANEYLTRANLMKAYLFPEYDTPLVKGKNVVVFGGGNVAMDALRTAMRMGADSVKCIYRRSHGRAAGPRARDPPCREEEHRVLLPA